MPELAVPVVLRQRLEAERRRDVPFEAAWPAALAAALDGLPRWDRQPWGNILQETSGTWRSAYERRGAGPLARALGRLGGERQMQSRLEVECAGPNCRAMVVVKRAGGIRATCSERCRRRATEAADREAVAV